MRLVGGAESITLGLEPSLRAAARARFLQTYTGKILQGHVLTAPDLEQILASDITHIEVRQNNIRGIAVEAITEGQGVIESLADRIMGRTLAEDIYSPNGQLIASVNQLITKDLAQSIANVRQRVMIRSVLTCRRVFLDAGPAVCAAAVAPYGSSTVAIFRGSHNATARRATPHPRIFVDFFSALRVAT